MVKSMPYSQLASFLVFKGQCTGIVYPSEAISVHYINKTNHMANIHVIYIMIYGKEQQQLSKITFICTYLCYLLATKHLLRSTYECITLMVHCQHTCQHYIALSTYCSTIYQTPFQSILALYTKKNVAKGHTYIIVQCCPTILMLMILTICQIS